MGEAWGEVFNSSRRNPAQRPVWARLFPLRRRGQDVEPATASWRAQDLFSAVISERLWAAWEGY